MLKKRKVVNFSLAAVTGRKKKNPDWKIEDRMGVKNIAGRNGEPDTTVFILCDGHAGPEAAEFSVSHLPNYLEEDPAFFSPDPATLKESIRRAFLKTHDEMFKVYKDWKSRLCKGYDLSTAGTTASLVAVRGRQIIVANVGDSPILMIKRDSLVETIERLSVNHKPRDPKESALIESRGGLCMGPIVSIPKWSHVPRNSQWPCLAMTRALGDFWTFNKKLNTYVISPEPSVSILTHDAESEDLFLLLCSDGVTDWLDDDKIMKTVCGYVEENPCGYHLGGGVDQTVADDLLEIAMEEASKKHWWDRDDMSCIVATL